MKHRYLFIGGLHRSGTSLTARLIEGIEGVSSIVDAPVPENEGVYLQGAIPHTALHGRPGHFATDPSQHHVEGSSMDRLDTRIRLEADWAPWFDATSPWRVEKSPVNLTRMRLYQQLFPLSQFIVVTRHPAAVATSTARWTGQGRETLWRYWTDAHEIVEADLAHLHAVLVLRYEDIVADPRAALGAVAAFLSLRPPERAPALECRNDPGDIAAFAAADPRISETAARWGYGGDRSIPSIRHPLRATRTAVEAAWQV